MNYVIQAAGTAAQFGLGWMGFRAAKKLKWPSPAIIGSLLILSIVNLCGVRIPFAEQPVVFITKVLSGVILGQKIERDTFVKIRKLALPILLCSLWMVGASVLAGYVLYAAGGGRLSLITSLASSAAGGIAEMSIFAMSAGGDVGIVAFFQSVRIVIVYVSLPFIVRWIASRRPRKTDEAERASRAETMTSAQKVLFVAAVCGAALAADALCLPSSYMLGAMLGAGAMNLCTGRSFPLPGWLRNVALICLSITVGVRLSPQTVKLATELFMPLIVSIALVQALSLVLAWGLSRFTGWDAMTLVLATCPGGVTQIVFIAEDNGANALVVGVFHTVRLLSIVLCVPVIAQLF